MPIWKMKRRSILTKRPFRKIKRRFDIDETPFYRRISETMALYSGVYSPLQVRMVRVASSRRTAFGLYILTTLIIGLSSLGKILTCLDMCMFLRAKSCSVSFLWTSGSMIAIWASGVMMREIPSTSSPKGSLSLCRARLRLALGALRLSTK